MNGMRCMRVCWKGRMEENQTSSDMGCVARLGTRWEQGSTRVGSKGSTPVKINSDEAESQ